jgi:hypothetical protein
MSSQPPTFNRNGRSKLLNWRGWLLFAPVILFTLALIARVPDPAQSDLSMAFLLIGLLSSLAGFFCRYKDGHAMGFAPKLDEREQALLYVCYQKSFAAISVILIFAIVAWTPIMGIDKHFWHPTDQEDWMPIFWFIAFGMPNLPAAFAEWSDPLSQANHD